MRKAPNQLFPALAYEIAKKLLNSAERSCPPLGGQGTAEIDPALCQQVLEVVANKSCTTFFQPIVELRSGLIMGYEALARGPEDGALHHPAELLAASRCYSVDEEIEALCYHTALDAAVSRRIAQRLFLNITVSHLARFLEDIKSAVADSGGYRQLMSGLVVEVDSRSIGTMPLPEGVTHPRGFALAIDNLGSGCFNLREIEALRPEYLKVDQTIIRSLNATPYLSTMVKGLIEFARTTGAQTIAVGVETIEDLKMVTQMGFNYAQGYFFASPAAVPPGISPTTAECIRALSSRPSSSGTLSETYGVTIGDIAHYSPAIRSDKLVADIKTLFPGGSAQGIVVVDEGEKPIGLVMKNTLYYHLGSNYGVSLYSKRPVELVMDKEPLVIDAALSLEAASHLAMGRAESKIYDLIIITRSGRYFGTVSVIDLLKQLTDLQIRSAANANPLTGLPGNLVIEDRLKQAVNLKDPFAVLYLDLDNFKAFNDKYGFEHGDKALKLTAAIINKSVTGCSDHRPDTIGHIGGDDFIIITQPEKTAAICGAIIGDFDQQIGSLYAPEDLARGLIVLPNRKGQNEEFPIMTISIAVVDNVHRQYANFLEIGEIAARLKKRAKTIDGSLWVTDQRQTS